MDEVEASSGSSWSSKAKKRYMDSSNVLPNYGPTSNEAKSVSLPHSQGGLRFAPPTGPVIFKLRRPQVPRPQVPPIRRERQVSPPRRQASPTRRQTSPPRRQASPLPELSSSPRQVSPPRRRASPSLSQASVRKTTNRPNLVGLQTIVTVNVRRGRTAIKRENEDSEHHKPWPFPVHKNHLCHYSEYFDQAINGPMELEEVDLYGTDPEIFGMFVNWLYTQEIVNKDGETPGFTGLVYLWLLGDRIQAPALQNQAIDLIEMVRNQVGTNIGSELFPYIYENSKDDCPLRLYVVEMCSATWLPAIERIENYPPRLLIDIINTIRSRATRHDQLLIEDMQKFHVREDEFDADRAKRRRL